MSRNEDINVSDTPDNCIFCRIARKEAPAHIIYEDEHAIAFLDAAPMTRGHTLLIPKAHHANLLAVPRPLHVHLTTLLPSIASSLLHTLNAQGFNVLQNNGSLAGQVVFHLHWHVVPRYSDDGVFPNGKEWEGGKGRMKRGVVDQKEGRELAAKVQKGVQRELELRRQIRIAQGDPDTRKKNSKL
ncbi:hypothetical protein HDV05_004192 [Chytridiales sp. JEL 0842]|nr:hypothetical protein HDV05_004192 [Chytridiales sp. JEL 0842]